MFKKLKSKILLIFILVLTAIFAKQSFTQASYEFPDSVAHTLITVAESKSNDIVYYCIDEHGYLRAWTDGWTTYYKVAQVEIKGNVATNVITGASNENIYNGILAYTLGGSSRAKGMTSGSWAEWQSMATARQQLMWGYMRNWEINSGAEIGVTGYANQTRSVGGELYDEALAYANSSKNIAQVSWNTENNKVTSNTKAGPLNFQYTGEISSIVVKDDSGNEITSGIKFYVNNKEVSAKDISSGTDFYIGNTSGKRLKSVTVNVKASGMIEADIAVYEAAYHQTLIGTHVSQTESEDSATIELKTYADLTIKKIDAKSQKAIDGVDFKIKTGNNTWLSKNRDGTYNYSATYANATAFTTAGGKGVTLTELDLRKYHIYETKTADGYDMSLQDGYDSTNNWVDFGEVTLDGSTEKVEKTFSNWKSISIGGYVWVDVPETKDNIYNSLYDNGEKRVEGVTVKLIRKSDGTAIATATTNTNGEYLFDKKVTENVINEYYVQFDYSGLTIEGKAGNKYIPVAFNSKDANEIKTNGSRALVSNVPTKDIDFKGIATTYKGTDSSKETTYGLSGNLFNKLYVDADLTLKNINLGIKERYDPEYSIEENIAYVKINMKGYTYTYNYGGTGNKNLSAAPTVRWQNKGSIKRYLQPIYPSDVAYEEKNAKNDLKVYVVYRIDIKNLENYNVEELYQEQKLMVTKVTNKFDTTRYTLHDNNWTASGNTATIGTNYLKTIYGNGLEKESSSTSMGTSFIEFEVKRDAILEILDTTKNPKGIIEEFPTEVTSVAHHEYTRKDYSWQNDITKSQRHLSSDDTRSASAPYLIFKLGEKRILSGKVFEDTVVTTDGQKLGDGKYNNENIVKDVKVELLDVDGTVSDLYDVQNNNSISRESSTSSDQNGNFTLTGIVPGEYYLRFTYGDGTQKIFTPDGTEVKDVKSKDYKSTIVTSSVTKDAILNGSKVAATKHEWYKKLEGENYSVAVDNIESRKIANADSTKNVAAATPRLSITVENDLNNLGNVSDNGEMIQKSQYKGFNFGIIVEPEQKVEIEKVVTHMTLINADNQQIFNGNPESDPLKGVSDLDGITNGGSTYARAELENEIINGSTLELTYGIKVTNISDVNYYGENYYWFGDSTGAYEVTLKINEVTDYLDETLKLSENTDTNGKTVTLTTETEEKAEGEMTRKLVKVLITDWKDVLYTTKNTVRTNKNAKTSDTANIGATRILSSQDQDMEMINEAEVTAAENASEPQDSNAIENIKTIPAMELDHQRAEAVVTVTPPTGEDRQSIMLYVVTGVVTLAILSAGIVIIKKKVL